MSEEYATSRVSAGESTCDVMQYAYREMLSPHMIAVMLATSACIVGVFMVVGPMGTQDAWTSLERLVFGAVYATAGWPICYSMNVVALYFLRLRALHEVALALTLLALFEAFPCSAVAYTVESLVHRQPTQGFLELYLLVATIAVACSLLFLYVVYQRLSRSTAPGAVATVTTGDGDGSGTEAAAAEQEVDNAADLAVLPVPEPSGAESENESASRDGDEPPSLEPPDGREVQDPLPTESNGMSSAAAASDPPDTDTDSPPSPSPNAEAPPAHRARPELAPRFAARRNRASARKPREYATILTMLPANLGTDVIYLKSEDHYIDVRTTVGQSLVKMRFSDAVAELGDRGIQVHRSYWVATSHVQRMARSGKRTLIRLTGGHQVPVSVTYLPAVRATVGR